MADSKLRDLSTDFAVKVIKIVTAYPDKIKSKTLNREHISVERTFFENSQKLSARKFFAELFFKKAT